MYCKKCGKQIDNDSIFCMYCGTNVSKTEVEKVEVDLPDRFESVIFIDSIFVKQTIEELKKYYPNIVEEDFSLTEIISRLIDYTNYKNYMVYYFEVDRSSPKPNINLDILGRSILIQKKTIKVELIKVDFLGSEMSKFFLDNEQSFDRTILIGDDVTYSDYLCKKGDFDNLTVFRRREGESRMKWGFYDKHGYFIDLIEEIYKGKK